MIERLYFSLSCTGEGNGNTLVFLPGESQGRGSLVGCRLWGRTESDTTSDLAAAAGTFFKIFIELLTILLPFYVFGFFFILASRHVRS